MKHSLIIGSFRWMTISARTGHNRLSRRQNSAALKSCHIQLIHQRCKRRVVSLLRRKFFTHKTEMVANFVPVVGCSGASRCAGASWLALIKSAPNLLFSFVFMCPDLKKENLHSRNIASMIPMTPPKLLKTGQGPIQSYFLSGTF